jgi:hypothetical protein
VRIEIGKEADYYRALAPGLRCAFVAATRQLGLKRAANTFNKLFGAVQNGSRMYMEGAEG